MTRNLFSVPRQQKGPTVIVLKKSTAIFLILVTISALVYAAAVQFGTTIMIDGYGPYKFGVYRIEDDERGAACWVFNGLFFGGISCIPHEELHW